LDLPELRRTAVTVAGEAAELAQDLRGGPLGFTGRVDSKSTEVDVVTAADEAAERLVRERLARLRPGEPVLGEEEGGDAGESRLCWVVDPIDGTVNYLYGFPLYCVSLAAQYDGVSVAGAVVEPVSGRVFSAATGHGATLTVPGAEPVTLRVNPTRRLDISLVATGFGYDRDRRGRQARLLAELAEQVRDFRRGGSAALELCAVAAGWTDAYYEHGLNRWDWAAGALIAEEAGAAVRLPGETDLIVAAAPGIESDLLGALRSGGADAV
jgi:myo-inositol-1(or 4)-monophosphatase